VDLRAPLVVVATFCTYCGGIAISDPNDPGGSGGSGNPDGSAPASPDPPGSNVVLACAGNFDAECATYDDCVSLVAPLCCGAYRVIGAPKLAMCTAGAAPACPGAQCAATTLPYATDDGRAAATLDDTRVRCENGKCRTSAQCYPTVPCAAGSVCVAMCDWAWCNRIPLTA
jgi:hypothetical protein